jgi:hypothetical protein
MQIAIQLLPEKLEKPESSFEIFVTQYETLVSLFEIFVSLFAVLVSLSKPR